MKIDDICFKLKDGREAVLHGPREEDIPGTLDYLVKSAGETEFIIRYPEECATRYTPEGEKKFFKSVEENPNMAFMTCVVDGKVAGNCQIAFFDTIKRRHTGEIGIAILKEYWGLGIGTKMFEEMERIAREREGVIQMELDFVEGNSRARALYEKMGFSITGMIPDRFMMRDGRLVAEYHMTKKLSGKEEVNPYPITEFYGGEAPIVDPEKFLKDLQLGYDKLIITFFPEVMNKLKAEKQIELYQVLGGENPVELYKFVDSDVLITLGYVGCPACAGNLECFYAMGIKKVMFCGGGGVLDKSIPVGTLIVVEGAIRDEGFSFKYLPPERIVYSDKKVVEKIDTYLDGHKIPYTNGIMWTTDAMFRETPSCIEKRKAEGAKVVEMEQAGCLAIAKVKGFDYGAIIYGGDDVSGDKWDTRSWNSREGIRYDLVKLCKDLVKNI